jgi:hypothetical protein
MLIAVPGVYSPMRNKGITTSSLILKALVCLLMAAVRCGRGQICRVFRADGATFHAGIVHTNHLAGGADLASAHHRPRCVISTILGKPLPPRLLLVA